MGEAESKYSAPSKNDRACLQPVHCQQPLLVVHIHYIDGLSLLCHDLPDGGFFFQTAKYMMSSRSGECPAIPKACPTSCKYAFRSSSSLNSRSGSRVKRVISALRIVPRLVASIELRVCLPFVPLLYLPDARLFCRSIGQQCLRHLDLLSQPSQAFHRTPRTIHRNNP